jgi:hypothetical protein
MQNVAHASDRRSHDHKLSDAANTVQTAPTKEQCVTELITLAAFFIAQRTT